jgi:hypothetical protein
LESQDFTLFGNLFSDKVPPIELGRGFSMFENSLRDNVKNMMIALGLSVAVIGTGLAVAFL